MEESKDSNKSLVCPFCSAPCRGVIPSNVTQLKCEYCGRTFSISPYLKRIISRHSNHPEVEEADLWILFGVIFILASFFLLFVNSTIGILLTLFISIPMIAHSLYKRHVKEADSWILLGVVFALFSFFILSVNSTAGTLLTLFVSVPMMAHGLYKRSIVKTVSKLDKIETRVSKLTQDVYTDTLYNKMFSKYAARWSVANAKEVLDNEIYAYVRQGLNYEEAVRRVAQAKGIIMATESEAS